MNVRLKWLKDQLNSKGLSGMIILNPMNIRYLTGLTEEGTLVINNKENIFITDSRYIESVSNKLTIDDEIGVLNIKEVADNGYEIFFDQNSNVGFEENFVTYEQYENITRNYKVNLIVTEGLIENQRIIKDEEEIECIKKACQITDQTFQYVINHIKKGMTEKDVAFEIEKYMIKNGADGLAFDSIVAFGENTSKPHAVPTDRVIRSGDIVQFDIGCKYNGYCSDFSRVIFIDEMKEEYKKVYDFILDEQKKIAISLKEGANIKQVIKDRTVDYGLKGYEIMHAFGHGVGLDIHETPVLRATKDYALKENTILAIEPGVYFEGRYGIRIEDTFLTERFAMAQLTKTSKDYTVIKLEK